MHSEFSRAVKPELLEICRCLSPSRIKDHYYLAGGTCLAMQIGHRSTDDLCFFSMNRAASLDAVSILKLLKILFPRKNVRINLKLSEQLDVHIDNTKIGFNTYDYPLLNPLLDGASLTEALNGLKLASVQDIALMKSFDIVRKPSFMDYIDLYFLLHTDQVDLAYILNHADRKFAANNKIDFYLKRFLERLRYPMETDDKAESLRTILTDQLSAEDIELYFEQIVLQYAKSKAPGNQSK